jgi:hypothetical protein
MKRCMMRCVPAKPSATWTGSTRSSLERSPASKRESLGPGRGRARHTRSAPFTGRPRLAQIGHERADPEPSRPGRALPAGPREGRKLTLLTPRRGEIAPSRAAGTAAGPFFETAPTMRKSRRRGGTSPSRARVTGEIQHWKGRRVPGAVVRAGRVQLRHCEPFDAACGVAQDRLCVREPRKRVSREGREAWSHPENRDSPCFYAVIAPPLRPRRRRN